MSTDLLARPPETPIEAEPLEVLCDPKQMFHVVTERNSFRNKVNISSLACSSVTLMGWNSFVKMQKLRDVKKTQFAKSVAPTPLEQLTRRNQQAEETLLRKLKCWQAEVWELRNGWSAKTEESTLKILAYLLGHGKCKYIDIDNKILPSAAAAAWGRGSAARSYEHKASQTICVLD